MVGWWRTLCWKELPCYHPLPMATKQINLRLDESLLTAIDDMRGLVPRNAWIKDALEQRIGGDMTVSYEYTQRAINVDIGSASSNPVTPSRVSPKLRSGIKPRPKGTTK